MSFQNVGDNLIVAGIFTSATHITCEICMRQRRLSDYFNALDDRFIMVDNAKIAALADPQSPPRSVPYAQLNRDTVLFAMAYAGEVPVEDDQKKRFVLIAKQPHRVTLSAPPFLLHGTLHLIRETGLRDALLAVRLPSLPLTNAEAIYLPTGQRFTGDILIVQRSRIETFCPSQPEEETLGTDHLS